MRLNEAVEKVLTEHGIMWWGEQYQGYFKAHRAVSEYEIAGILSEWLLIYHSVVINIHSGRGTFFVEQHDGNIWGTLPGEFANYCEAVMSAANKVTEE